MRSSGRPRLESCAATAALSPLPFGGTNIPHQAPQAGTRMGDTPQPSWVAGVVVPDAVVPDAVGPDVVGPDASEHPAVRTSTASPARATRAASRARVCLVAPAVVTRMLLVPPPPFVWLRPGGTGATRRLVPGSSGR